MNGLNDPTFLTAWIISNIIGVLILWAAFKRPKWARLALFLVFAVACWINYTTAQQSPEVYLSYSEYSVQVYQDFINGWFSSNISTMVSLIAIGQGMIAIGMILRGWWVKMACIGAIVFLLAIAPLGVGSGFPFPFVVALAAWFILQKREKGYIWQRNNRSKENSAPN